MPVIKLSYETAEHEVKRLFSENPPIPRRLCRNPVTGGLYVGGEDSVWLQMEVARRALLTRQWHAFTGPSDAQPLPISGPERDETSLRGTLLHYILAKFARSVDRNYVPPLGWDWDNIEHPTFPEYAAGVLWETEGPIRGVTLPNYGAAQLEELRKRFPPRMLKGMSAALTWLP